MHQIANGINVERLALTPSERPRARVRFGFDDTATVAVVIARLAEQKGVDIAIDSIALSGAQLLVVGVGEALENLKAHAEKAGVSSSVHFVGELDRDGVRDALHAADVFLFTPRDIGREGLPLSVLEALAASLPVIAPVGPLWPENIRDQLSLVHSTEAGEFAAAMSQARASNRPHLDKEYSVSSVAGQYLDLFIGLRASAGQIIGRRVGQRGSTASR